MNDTIISPICPCCIEEVSRKNPYHIQYQGSEAHLRICRLCVRKNNSEWILFAERQRREDLDFEWNYVDIRTLLNGFEL